MTMNLGDRSSLSPVSSALSRCRATALAASLVLVSATAVGYLTRLSPEVAPGDTVVSSGAHRTTSAGPLLDDDDDPVTPVPSGEEVHVKRGGAPSYGLSASASGLSLPPRVLPPLRPRTSSGEVAPKGHGVAMAQDPLAKAALSLLTALERDIDLVESSSTSPERLAAERRIRRHFESERSGLRRWLSDIEELEPTREKALSELFCAEVTPLVARLNRALPRMGLRITCGRPSSDHQTGDWAGSDEEGAADEAPDSVLDAGEDGERAHEHRSQDHERTPDLMYDTMGEGTRDDASCIVHIPEP